ncbi:MULTISPECIES: ABC transporter substrate-binding protein [Rhodococcus]|uniref:Extracellular solute-binding protein n=1 Tax=Rhodococcus oxybenzonivorans TaxID=1990687 RepID=A0AAE4V4S0_9NOCA|nr:MULTISPECIES: extracellular solute-binding protein [Rhodococcus]MDV7245359.1 extracellular solute-binding protein [Rhodococcus oxybenzonivorans]MDV7267843.1 extracellular solute-binding protein [Rhodococcus oxybenzonivorans]MDV7272361.1 extracellular solute-binding protein [Rhodococcus oxybenzonivorans]MDV7336384.1 extracellular solute-binding protein [Rhodococcus oxybenzonivorans]MDV7347684.1 extracellular solute-binding protein [Rhodococcus oxybenzonivorans]
MALVLASAAVACSSGGGSSVVEGSWDEVLAAAKSEGSVMLYSAQHPKNLEALQAAWAQKYPEITLEFVRGTDVDLIPRIDVENRTGKGTADVHITTDTAWTASASDSGDYSTTLLGPSFDNPAYEPDVSIKNDRFFLTTAATFGLGWNTTVVPEGIQDPTDVFDPKYQGRVGIVKPVGIASYVDFYDFYNENFGDDFAERLAKMNPRIYPSALGVAQALTSGEVVVSPMVQPLVRELESGAPVNWTLPKPSWGTPFYGHVTKAAPHPNAAQVLADFLVSVEGQTALATATATALPDIPGAVANAHEIQSPDPTELTSEYVEKASREWEQLFT